MLEDRTLNGSASMAFENHPKWQLDVLCNLKSKTNLRVEQVKGICILMVNIIPNVRTELKNL